MEIRIDNTSDFLYHFTKREILIEKILPSLRLKLNHLKNTNDPRESRLSTKCVFNNFQFAGEFLGVTFEFQTLIDNKYKICCFSGDYFRDSKSFPGYGLPRMWAMYGDNHKGVCLMISKSKFKAENKIDNENSLLSGVIYEKPISNKIDLINEPFSNDYKKVAEKLIKENRERIFFSKHHDWLTENEIRYLTNSELNFCSIKGSLVRIILGLDFNNKYIPSIRELLHNNQSSNTIEIKNIRFEPLTGELRLK